MKGRCMCGQLVEIDVIDGRRGLQFVGHHCAKRPLTPKGAGATSSGDDVPPSGRLVLGGLRTNAVRTKCGCGRTHPSKLQARVCARLRSEIESGVYKEPVRLYHDAIMPLFSLAPKPSGKPFTICVDFVIAFPTGLRVFIDAKDPKRTSRDWPARAAAFAVEYGQPIKEVDR